MTAEEQDRFYTSMMAQAVPHRFRVGVTSMAPCWVPKPGEPWLSELEVTCCACDEKRLRAPHTAGADLYVCSDCILVTIARLGARQPS